MYFVQQQKKNVKITPKKIKEIFVKEVGIVANLKLSAEEYNILKARYYLCFAATASYFWTQQP